MKPIIDLKQQIASPVRFFKVVISIVETCFKDHMEPFLVTARANVADGTDPNADLKTGDTILTDLKAPTHGIGNPQCSHHHAI